MESSLQPVVKHRGRLCFSLALPIKDVHNQTDPVPPTLQMVVSAIVDTLKTAFPRSEPQSPTEELSEAENESKPQTEGKKASK